MTRKEAIERLKNIAWLCGSSERDQNIKAIDMAIESLSAKPSSDFISKADLLKKLKRRKKFFIDVWGGFHLLSITDRSRVDELDACIAEVTNAPSADRPTGKWVEKDGETVCSLYGNSVSFSWTEDGWVLGKFCQTCGARMGGDTE